jgi:uncharacterized delta-60 repeat protein
MTSERIVSPRLGPDRPARLRLPRPLLLLLLALTTVAAAPLRAAPIDGDLDATFDSDGWKPVVFDEGGGNLDELRAIAVQDDGRIVAVGSATTGTLGREVAVARLFANGAFDGTFAGGATLLALTAQDDIAHAVAIQPDGKILVGGSVDAGGPIGFVARLLTNGSLDQDFGDEGVVAFLFVDNYVSALALQPDGKILVAGSIDGGAPGGWDFFVLRLTDTGATDGTFGSPFIGFDAGDGNEDLARSLALQPDGKVLVAGSAQFGATDYDFAVARLTSTGLLDATFGTGGKVTFGFDLGGGKADHAAVVRVAPDGRIVLSGYVEAAGGGNVAGIARLRSIGDPDLAFSGDGRQTVTLGAVGGGGGSGMIVQDDGAILLVGSSGNPDFDLASARLLATGEPDSGYGAGAGLRLYDFTYGGCGQVVHTPVAELQPDGKLALGAIAEYCDPDYDFFLARLWLSLIFADDFEPDAGRWSSAVP